MDRRDRHLCHVALCHPARFQGPQGTGRTPELVGRRLVGLVDVLPMLKVDVDGKKGM